MARLHRVADRFLRSVGNRSGRGRMRADTTLRAEYHPRGLVLGSGEDVPHGQSLRARKLVSEVSRGDVDLDVLTELQKAGAEGLLASTMSAYVKWLAPRMADLKECLPTRQTELREHASGAGTHARTPGIVASLALGLETFLEFAVQEGALAEARATELRDEGWKALREAAAAQAEHQAGEEPTQQFRELLAAAVASGRAYLADAKTGTEPLNAERWGWRDTSDELRPQGKLIGWLNPDGALLLEPGAAFAAAQQMARDQGTSLPISKQTLWKRLKEKGLLASRDSRGERNNTRATVAGERRPVIHLIAGALSENDPNAPPPGTGGGLGPEDGAHSPAGAAETACSDDPEAAENGSSGPKGPVGPFVDGESSNRVGQGAPPHGLRYSLDGEARLINTEAGVHALLPELRGADRVALDVETTGLDPREHQVRLLALATEQGSWLVDCDEVDPRPLFPTLSQKKLLIHNALFDLGMLSQMGFEIGEGGEVIDTMLASQLSEGRGPEEEKEEEE